MSRSVRLTVDAAAPTWAHDLARQIEQLVEAPASAPVRPPAYAVADLPGAPRYSGGVVFVTDTGRLAYSDGAGWRYIVDGSAV